MDQRSFSQRRPHRSPRARRSHERHAAEFEWLGFATLNAAVALRESRLAGPPLCVVACSPGEAMAEKLRCIALLRGVNVGGNNRLAMPDLRGRMQNLGYENVETILQSGNAVFTATAKQLATASADIGAELKRELNLDVRVIVRTARELERVSAADPFVSIANDPAKHFVGFLATTPAATGVAALGSLVLVEDQVKVVGEHLYLWCPNGYSKSPLFKFAWDRQFATSVTMRNWNTVDKIRACLA